MSRASTFYTSTNGGGASSTNTGAQDASGGAHERPYFEVQREGLMREVGSSMESVLQNINKLNRSLEGIISVGNEFSSVEALWSHFENVMAKDGSSGADGAGAEEGGLAEDEPEAAR